MKPTSLIACLLGLVLCSVYAQPAAPPSNDGMVYVEGGAFTFGNPESIDLLNPNQPLSEKTWKVALSPFYIASKPLTVGEFSAFVASTHYRTTTELSDAAYVVTRESSGFGKGYSWRKPGYDQHADSPVTCVSWLDAVAYCNWLSKKEGRKPCYSIDGSADLHAWKRGWNAGLNDSIQCDWKADGYRLPTEAEFEFAARGGTRSLGYRFAGGDAQGELAWFAGNSNFAAHPVGSKKPNELGLYDMSGNVLQWCWDWDGVQPGNAVDPTGSKIVWNRVLKGSSWIDEAASETFRKTVESPNQSMNFVGLRLAASDVAHRISATAPSQPEANGPEASSLLQFRVGDRTQAGGLRMYALKNSSDAVYLSDDIALTERDIEKATLSRDNISGKSTIVCTLKKNSADRFMALTEKNIGRCIGLFIRGELVMSATIQEPIRDKVRIGSFAPEDEMRKLVSDLNK